MTAPPSRLGVDTTLVQRQFSPLHRDESPNGLPSPPHTPHGHPLTNPLGSLSSVRHGYPAPPPRRPTSTPLPITKMIPLCIARSAEGLMYAVIFPYINEMIHDFGVPEKSVGVWSAAAESALMVTESIAAPLYAPLADRLGRKPVFVPVVAMWGVFAVAFGFAPTPMWAVLLRGCLGLLAGAGVLSRIMVGEMCDKTNRVKGFAVFSPALTVGMALAPLVGGFLAHPVPKLLPPAFSLFVRYPYLLPALITGLIGFMAAASAVKYLPETLPENVRNSRKQNETSSHGKTMTLLRFPKFLRFLVLYLLNNAVMCTWDAVFPLYAFTEQKLGGLELSTQMIGLVLAISASFSIGMTMFVFPGLHDKLPEERLLTYCLLAYPAAVLLFPVLWAGHFGADNQRLSFLSWLLLVIQIVLRRLGDFSATMLDANLFESIPGPEYTAMANSITFSCAAVGRATGPFIICWFFSVSTTFASPFSLGRQVVWLAFILLCLPSIHLARSVEDGGRGDKPGGDSYSLSIADEEDGGGGERHELLNNYHHAVPADQSVVTHSPRLS